MADYHSPTVVQPNIPAADMTPLERLVLNLVFDATVADDGIYFHSWCGPASVVTLPVDELRAAAHASGELHECSIGRKVVALLSERDAATGNGSSGNIDVDLSDEGWDAVFQDIVRRSDTIDAIVVTTAFTCTSMRPDGFGGSVMRITSGAIQYASTGDMLEKIWNEPQPASMLVGSGHETRSRIECIAGVAGWDGYTLLVVMSRWLDQQRQTESLISFLDSLAADEEA